MGDLAFKLRVQDDGSAVIEGFAKQTRSATFRAAKSARTASARIARAFSGVRRATRRVTGGFSTLAKSALTLKNLFVGGLAAIVVQRGFRAITSAAAAQEDAVNKLNNALQTAGVFTDKLSASSQALASSLQLQTRFGDETILSAQALLVTYGVTADKLDAATKATLDFAVATGRDLTTAALTIGKAAAGFTAELSRYGIVVKTKGIPQTKIFDAVLVKMNKQFGGRAQADVKTFSGGMAQLSNAFGDVLEEFGFGITKSKIFRKSIKELSIGLAALSGGLREARGETAETGDAFSAFIPAAETVITLFSFIERTLALVKGAFFALGAAVLSVVGAVAVFLDIFGDFTDDVNDVGNAFEFAAISAKENFDVLVDGSEGVKQSRKVLSELREELRLLDEQSDKTKDQVEGALGAFKTPEFLEQFGFKTEDTAFRFAQAMELVEFSSEESLKRVRLVFANLPRDARLGLLATVAEVEGGVKAQADAFRAGVERIERDIRLRGFELVPEITFRTPETGAEVEERLFDRAQRLSNRLGELTEVQRMRVQEQIALAEGGFEAVLAIGEGAVQEEIIRERKKNSTLIAEASKFGQNLLTIGKALGLKTAESEKALGVTRAIVNTAIGISRAFADLPFPAALGAAAVIAASGAAQIATILSAKPGGGGGGVPAVGGGGGGAVGAVPPTDVPTEIDPIAGGPIINISVAGIVGDESLLAEEIFRISREALGDGLELGVQTSRR